MNPLPVFNTVLMIAAALKQNWQSLLVSLVIPAASILIVEAVTADLFPNGFFYAFLTWALSAPFYALFAVVVHRTVILGSESLPNRYGIFWSARETRFVGWTIALFILTLGLAFFIGIGATILAGALPPGPLTFLVLFGVWFVVAYIYTRLSMLFPATAIDDATSFERAWQLTDGNGIRMIVVMLLTVGVVFALTLGIAHLISAGFFAQIVNVLLSFVVMLVGVCAVSVTYRQLISIEREQSGTSPGDSPTKPSNG